MRCSVTDCVFMCWKKCVCVFKIVQHAHQRGFKGVPRRACVSMYCTNTEICASVLMCVQRDAHVYSKYVRARWHRLHRYHLPHMTALHPRHQAVCSAEQLTTAHVITAAPHTFSQQPPGPTTPQQPEKKQPTKEHKNCVLTFAAQNMAAGSSDQHNPRVQVSFSAAPSAPSVSFDCLGRPPFQS